MLTIRVIHDPPQSGPLNMAADETLLNRVGAGDSPPTLRFYQWDPPTISLGYFQKYADYEALPPPAGELPVVRRLTGGGAILHDRELTYSLALPVDHPLLSGGPNRLYELAHDAVIACLSEAGIDSWRGCETDDSTAARGPFFCFARRHCLDVLVGDRKLAGSAQRRTRTGVLQHGSIIFEQRFAQQPVAAVREATDLAPADLADRFAAAFAAQTGCRLDPGEWTEAEREATGLLANKYAGRDWLRRR
ncbi:MAG TPA: lipoate--protein ligase family protein [Phycisphaerae bacterium]|nr:lipoate--protein ligase family protein [Phycisphaerae bacterium]